MIRKLSPALIQQIAAGEVIERPASVLKELLENSIDADAREIKVQSEGAGLLRLCVSDDGLGISEGDLPLVCEAHATSKLQAMSDFESLSSMGFRGEAMGVLAHISELEIWTTPRASELGFRLKNFFGKQTPIEVCERRSGTEVQVVHLFQNLPVRQKFLKSASAESRRLLQCFRRYALAHPEITWSYQDPDRKREVFVAASSLWDRVLWFFDANQESYWWQAEGQDRDWSLVFVALKPRYLKASRQSLQIFLNRRPIEDRRLEFAVRRAYEGYTEHPQWAVGALFLEGPAADFDVNVHPTKAEVRFVDADRVFSLIVHSLRASLSNLHSDHQAETSSGLRREENFSAISSSSASSESLASSSWGEPSSSKSARGFLSAESTSPTPAGEALSLAQTQAWTQTEIASFALPECFEYLAAIDCTYLLARKQERLFLFDQHALHERILYEALWKEHQEKGKLQSQRLLFPIQISILDSGDWMEKEKDLEDLGFELREWGNSGLQVLAVPSLLKRQPEKLLPELLDMMAAGKESLLRDLLATMACHSAIRAKDPISNQEAERLLRQFDSEDALGHCPHGRPTFIELKASELGRFFHRT
ncbi:MAG: DNA mismatch repair endonuclease MutL [Bradymonadales bacterium]|nr:MAG: DNA mismatch repair endonuclease MutL [Bradymonadales bacterium]